MAAPPDVSLPPTEYVTATADDSGIIGLERNSHTFFRLSLSLSLCLERRGAGTWRREGAWPRGRAGARLQEARRARKAWGRGREAVPVCLHMRARTRQKE